MVRVLFAVGGLNDGRLRYLQYCVCVCVCGVGVLAVIAVIDRRSQERCSEVTAVILMHIYRTLALSKRLGVVLKERFS